MKEYIKRLNEYSKSVMRSDEAGYNEQLFKDKLEKNPELKKKLQDSFKIAISTLEVQFLNGIGLNMDVELRYYLNEFNSRTWDFGHGHMPSMFNVLEAFFHFDKELNYWELLEEEDYLISYFDFVDYYTSNEFVYNINSIKENLTEGLIYNYNVGADIAELTFKTEEGSEFVIAGLSIIRRGNEVNILFLSGEITDTQVKTSELPPLSKGSATPGRGKVKPDPHWVREAVRLNGNPNWWKVLIACRLDLETETLDARYVAKDEGNSYSITTDDITAFLKGDKWKDSSYKKVFESTIRRIETYNSIFELAKASLYLPQYFNNFENYIEEEQRDTKVKSIISNPIHKSKYKAVDGKFKLRTRSLWLLNRNNIFSSDIVVLRDDKFKVETSGYWKDLYPDEVGIDKKGNKITGRTWVNKTESYFQANSEDLIVTKVKQEQKFEEDTAGYIYIMRNPALEKDIFKIGLTTKKTDVRAKQLSKTSIPDHFHTMREWMVRDCIKAEKEIHELLKRYRIDPRREFFKMDMKIANETIDIVVERINSETDS